MQSQPLTFSNRQPIHYNILWTTDKKTDEKALLSCSYLSSLQKSVWSLWGGVTYTLEKYKWLPLKVQAWKFQVEEIYNYLPAEKSTVRIPPPGTSRLS